MVKINNNFEHKSVYIFFFDHLNICFGCSKEQSLFKIIHNTHIISSNPSIIYKKKSFSIAKNNILDC